MMRSAYDATIAMIDRALARSTPGLGSPCNCETSKPTMPANRSQVQRAKYVDGAVVEIEHRLARIVSVT